MIDIDAAVVRLEEAERTTTGIMPFSREHSDFTEQDAWAIAAERDRRRAATGDRQTGYKLGWTSAAMREALCIDRPNHGALWASMAQDGELSTGSLIHPKAEPEFAFCADRTLAGPDLMPADVIAGGSWAVALEIVDPRWESYDFTWLDNTADGSSAAGYAIGPFRALDGDPATLQLSFAWDGPEGGERAGTGDAALGSPAAAVAHLVRELHGTGAHLTAGMVVLTGGITAPIDLRPGLHITVRSEQLGSCSLRCR